MLVHANKAALKDAEKTFEGVGVDLMAMLALANILLGVIHAFMRRDHGGEFVGRGTIGMQDAVGVDVLADRVLDFIGSGAFNSL